MPDIDGAGLDIIQGMYGEDVITGGEGNDQLSGGFSFFGDGDADIFIFDQTSGADTITDFEAFNNFGDDKIDLTAFGLASTAFLWLPPQARQVRGVIMAGMTLMEREFVKDALTRQACQEQQLALVFLKCGLNGADLQKVLDDLAKVSGYKELSVAPLMFVGHSAGGPQARTQAIKMADRCFGLVQYRDKTASHADAVRQARALHALTRRFGVPLLINDRVDVALDGGCDGVHLGQDDMGA